MEKVVKVITDEFEYVTVVRRRIQNAAGDPGVWSEAPGANLWTVGGPEAQTCNQAYDLAQGWIDANPVDDGWQYGIRLVTTTTTVAI